MISFQYVLALLLMRHGNDLPAAVVHAVAGNRFTKEQVAIIEAPAVSDSSSDNKTSFFKTSALQVNGVRNIQHPPTCQADPSWKAPAFPS